MQGLKLEQVETIAALTALMERGNQVSRPFTVSNYDDAFYLQARTVASTKMNNVSSRSHAVFTINFSQTELAESSKSAKVLREKKVPLHGCFLLIYFSQRARLIWWTLLDQSVLTKRGPVVPRCAKLPTSTDPCRCWAKSSSF